MDNKITTIAELKRWIRIQLALKNTTQREIAQNWKIAETRLSEAVNGNSQRKELLKRLLTELGGNLKDFSEII